MAGPHELGLDFALPKKDKNKSLAPTWASCSQGSKVQCPAQVAHTQRCSLLTVV